jgi:large subunit ribosomal protein L25
MNDFILNAEARSDLGKGASRRLRHALVPCCCLRWRQKAQSITMLAKEIAKLLENEAPSATSSS